MPFVEVASAESDPGQKPILYVPGFGEGIINKASFAAELALRGRRVILPGQSRRGTLKNKSGQPDATYTQAFNTLAVQQAAGARSADIVTHSYGSLVFDEMARLAPEWFEDSDVVMLAPAGSVRGERLPALGMRWLKFMKSEADQNRPMEFPDRKNRTGNASARVLAANPARTAREAHDLWKREVDYIGLSRDVASLAVLSYAEDEMYPDHTLAPALADAVSAGHITWATPVSSEKARDGEIAYGGAGAVHDDEQYNPSRVAAATLEFLN